MVLLVVCKIAAATWFDSFGSTPSKTVIPHPDKRTEAERTFRAQGRQLAAQVLPFSLTIGLVAVKTDCDSCSGLLSALHRWKKAAWSICAGSENFVTKTGILTRRFIRFGPLDPVKLNTGHSEKSLKKNE